MLGYRISVTIRGVVIYYGKTLGMGWKRTTKLRQVHVEYKQEKAKEEALILSFAKTRRLVREHEYLYMAIAHDL